MLNRALFTPLKKLGPLFLFTFFALSNPLKACEVNIERSAQRSLPLKVSLPAGPQSSLPVVLYSHGLGGSNAGAKHWAAGWTAANYAVIQIQHPGSDASLLRASDRRAALMSAVNPSEFVARVDDFRFVMDMLEGKKPAPANCGFERMDAKRLAVAGHSYGAQTVQALIGQRFDAAGGVNLVEPRAKAAILFSPNSPRGSAEAITGLLDAVKVPVLVVTGSDDGPVLGMQGSPEARQAVFHALPKGQKAMIVFDKGDHWTFSGGGSEMARRANARDEAIWASTREATKLFLDSHVKGPQAGEESLSAQLKSLTTNGDKFFTK